MVLKNEECGVSICYAKRTIRVLLLYEDTISR